MAELAARTETLLDRAARGDTTAPGELLQLHRDRLKRMVAIHMDSRLRKRIDPSDVVQDVVARAWERLPEYLRERPIPFYPWLRQIATQRLVDLARRHIGAQRRSVRREKSFPSGLPDGSSEELALRLLSGRTSLSKEMARAELRERIRGALARLADRDREVLVLRYLEGLSSVETAAVLRITDGAVRVRQLRALQRFHELLGALPGEVP